jgi:predicted membrane chloride channel (bestrophin family)
MRQKLITLCPITWDLAQKKSNFSAWIRNQLRSERNKTENDDALKANTARQVESVANISSAELLWHLEQRSPEEIGALISILKNGLA